MKNYFWMLEGWQSMLCGGGIFGKSVGENVKIR